MKQLLRQLRIARNLPTESIMYCLQLLRCPAPFRYVLLYELRCRGIWLR